MNRAGRKAAAAVALGLLTALGTTGVAHAADLLEAPTGERASEAVAWTPAVSRSYARVYTEVACSTVDLGPGDAALDLGAAPAGTWMFAVVGPPGDQHQYGPAELLTAPVPAGTTQAIACHGVPAGVPLAVSARSEASHPDQDHRVGAGAPADGAEQVPVPQPSATVPATVEAGIASGGGGLVILAGGLVGVGVLALRGRSAKAG